MFEIGFTEILVITVLALVVLGPEKLPRVAAQVGRWIGRARTMARQFREQLEDEVQLAETSKSKPSSTAGADSAGTSSSTSTPPDGTANASGSAAADPGPPIYSDIANSDAGYASGSSSDASSALPPEVAAANAAAETAHSDSNGPAPEPEAAEYQPPLYSQSGGASDTQAGSNGASHGGTSGGQSSGAQSSTVESSSNHDEPPRKAGDFITQTHERGI